jgi:DNA replication protein DnaC
VTAPDGGDAHVLDEPQLIVVDEIGYLPLERQAANLLFALGGEAMVAAALIDRLIHHTHMVTLKDKSYRLRERASGARATGSDSRPPPSA